MTHNNRSKSGNKTDRNPKGLEIAELRKSHGLNQNDFGKIMFYTKRNVTAWETGVRRMHPAIWESYLVYFGRIEPRRF